MATMTDKLTCLIPLFKSSPFLDIIIENIEEHLNTGARVLISDQHCFDRSARLIKQRFRREKRVGIFESKAAGDWVDNINFLIRKVETPFARIIPHDDSASGESSTILVQALMDNPDAILASGIVRAFDLHDVRLPHKDELNANESASRRTWTFNDKMDFFWKSRYAGAFKGVWRTNAIVQYNLYIKKTPTLQHSERLWLSALAMVGRFQFVPESVLIKRYYSTSTHAKWLAKPDIYLNSAQVLLEYLDQLKANVQMLEKAKFIIYHNAIRKTRAFATKIGNADYSDITPGINE